jgi:hypothetical protein
MRRTTDPMSIAEHRKAAAYLFNLTWSLLDRKPRTPEEDNELVHAAHASRFHWGRAGRPVNLSVGEWQVSRVYAILGRPEPAFYHGQRALEIARRARLGRFYLAYSYEALARAAAVAGRMKERDRNLLAAQRIGKGIRDKDDQRMLWEDLATIRGPPPRASRRTVRKRVVGTGP